MRTLWCVLLVMLGLLTPASEAADWVALVKEYVQAYESVERPVPTAYPWVAKRLKTLFGVRGVGHIQVFAEENGKRTLGAESTTRRARSTSSTTRRAGIWSRRGRKPTSGRPGPRRA